VVKATLPGTFSIPGDGPARCRVRRGRPPGGREVPIRFAELVLTQMGMMRSGWICSEPGSAGLWPRYRPVRGPRRTPRLSRQPAPTSPPSSSATTAPSSYSALHATWR
jgi:hypothetical protein